MLDWNDPDDMKRYQTALNAYKRYKRLADKSDYKRYISFDIAKKRMHIVPVDSDSDAESYPIGKLLLDFVNLDLTDYQREWEKVRGILECPDEYIDYSYFDSGMVPVDLCRGGAEYAKSLCLDRLVKKYQHLHPYFLVFDTTYMTHKQYDYSERLDTELNLFDVQGEIRSALICI